MLNPAQTKRVMGKLRRMLDTYSPYMFRPLETLDFQIYETQEELFCPPQEGRPIKRGESWGASGSYGWFQAKFVPGGEMKGKAIYLLPHFGGVESLLFLDSMPWGIFTAANGKHVVSCLTTCCDGSPMDLAVEVYTGHSIPGVQPLRSDPPLPDKYVYQGAEIAIKDEDVYEFIFDLQTLLELEEVLPETSFRRAQVTNCLISVYSQALQSPQDASGGEWRASLVKAREIMAPCLTAKNGPSAPVAAMVGHSHMDTSWLWPSRVTLKKCARTYSNQLNLMEQYPEHRFFQSSAYHLELMRRYYPKLFAALAEKIREGRYEPNGGVWVECDCNVPSGESIVRQFLWGQRYTQKYFGYRSNCFWLPDTFGYNAAIPQIMKGCGVDYFVTTKLSWNDTTRFPWETFYWEGIDGSKVFTHFTVIENWPGPAGLVPVLCGTQGAAAMPEKRIVSQRILPYGHGDGGGGPRFEMLELARRCKDLEGCPRVEIVNVGKTLVEMEQSAHDVPTHRGELYLELHRGTLTNQHQIKRNNRKAEISLHNLELAEVLTAVSQNRTASGDAMIPLWEDLLVNQFHDILPGTCLQEVHERAERQVNEVIERAESQTAALMDVPHDNHLTLLNPLGFNRHDTVYLRGDKLPIGCTAQKTQDVTGAPLWAVDGVEIAPLSAVSLALEEAEEKPGESPFRYDGKILETPFARIVFDRQGRIESFYDLRLERELRDKSGLPLNTFLFGEDVPANWDNWDVDADLCMKLAPAGRLIAQMAVSNGAVEFRLRNRWQLTEKTSLTQDMVFHAKSPRIDFETELDWHDRHRFLKAAFDLDFRADRARNEIQFGYCLRPTTRNTEQEQAMFEVCNHRYTDLSELDQGAAILNDCKYGVSVEDGSIRLSLHKGGCRPDDRGDAGLHRFTYSFFPHDCGFGPQVVQEGYLLNYPPVQSQGARPLDSLAWIDKENVILETVKPCEDGGRSFILRLYEAAGCHTAATLTCPAARQIESCNLLEEPRDQPTVGTSFSLVLRPFQIVTLKVEY